MLIIRHSILHLLPHAIQAIFRLAVEGGKFPCAITELAGGNGTKIVERMFWAVFHAVISFVFAAGMEASERHAFRGFFGFFATTHP